MKSILLFVAIAIAIAAAAPAPLLLADLPTVVPGSYIVVFKTNVAAVARDAHVRRVRGLSEVDIKHRFVIGDFAGYSGSLSSSSLTFVRSQPEVAYVEADQVIKVSACSTQSNTPSWGLDRIAEVDLNLDGVYPYTSSAGAGVDSYIVDTGIYLQNQDFQGRAIWGANYADSENTDCNGHGTHVAGTVGGYTFGVAKKTTLIAVKVLTCAGSGTNSGVISGINYVASSAAQRKNPSVANMSLGGGKSTAINQAVAASVKAGITFVVAAGNDNDDACYYSPASEPSAITVGATEVAQQGTTQEDERSSFSNYGSCVDVFAPGTQITSAWIGSATAQKTISGTSMASPHVAGVVALLLGNNGTLTPAQVTAKISSTATANYINLDCANAYSSASCQQSPNQLVYASC